MKRFLALGLILSSLACSGNPAPKLIAVSGDKLAQSIGELQILVKNLQIAAPTILTPPIAIKVQEGLLKANTEVSKLPEVIKILESAGEHPNELQQATVILQAANSFLTGAIVGLPSDDQINKLVTAVQSVQNLVITTTIEIAKLGSK